jgi:hypothetical protein
MRSFGCFFNNYLSLVRKGNMLNIEKEIQLIISYIYKKGEVNTTTTNNY